MVDAPNNKERLKLLSQLITLKLRKAEFFQTRRSIPQQTISFDPPRSLRSELSQQVASIIRQLNNFSESLLSVFRPIIRNDATDHELNLMENHDR